MNYSLRSAARASRASVLTQRAGPCRSYKSYITVKTPVLLPSLLTVRALGSISVKPGSSQNLMSLILLSGDILVGRSLSISRDTLSASGVVGPQSAVSALSEVGLKIEAVEAEIVKTEAKIDLIDGQIRDFNANQSQGDPNYLQYLLAWLTFLQGEKQSLRNKKQSLRNEKQSLLESLLDEKKHLNEKEINLLKGRAGM